MATTATEWLLSNQDYDEGLLILTNAGASSFMIDLLSSGADDYNCARLLQEISALPADVPTTEESTEEVEIKADGLNPTLYSRDKNLEKTIRIKEQIRQLFKEIGHLKAKLPMMAEGNELYEVAKQILLRDLQKQDKWEHLHYFETKGLWFDELSENKPKPANLEQAIKNAMANRAKASAYLKKPQPVIKQKYYQERVAAWTMKIDELIKQRPNA